MADDYSMSDFVTPGQVEAQRRMAEALLRQSMITPVGREHEAVSPFAIGTQMTQALMGRMGIDQAGQKERASAIGGQQARPEAAGGPPGMPYAGGGSTDVEGKALSMLESGGDYNALGPVIKKGPMAGDRAYGKYQIMGSNIPRWTQEFLGHQMTPGEFLRNPEAQEAVRKGKFAQYEQKYGPEGAARAWLGGPGGVNHPERADQLGTTIGQYGQNFTRNVAQLGGAQPSPTNGQALAFSGEPTPAPAEPPGSPAAMSSALAGTEVAAGRGAPAAVSTARPGGGIAPGLIPTRPHMTKAQFDRAYLSADPEARRLLELQYYQQNQPQVVKDPLGRDVVVGPDGTQMLINPPVEAEQQVGDIKGKIYRRLEGTVDNPYYRRIPTTGVGRPAAPAAPAAAEEPVPSLKFAPEGEGAKGEALPAEITKGPEAAAAERKGMLGTAPPKTPLPFAETQLPNAPTGLSPGAKTTPLEDMPMEQQAEWKRQFDLNKEAAKTFSHADVEKAAKTNEQFQNNARDTIQLENYINIGKKMLDDPRLQAMLGPGAGLKEDWNKFLTFFGNKDAEAATGLSQAFKKVVSSGIIGTLKADYGGLGQIRNKEIELSEKATASNVNTVEANKAVLDIAGRVVKQKQMLGKLANLYIQGQRWDADGNPIPGKTVERPTFDGLTQVTNEYLKNHPLFDDKIKGEDGKTELDRYLNIFKSSEKTEGKKRKEGALPPGGKMGDEATPPPAAAPKKGLATHELPPGGSFH